MKAMLAAVLLSLLLTGCSITLGYAWGEGDDAQSATIGITLPDKVKTGKQVVRQK